MNPGKNSEVHARPSWKNHRLGKPALHKRNKKIIRMYEKEGTTHKQIGKKYGVTAELVRQILKRAQVATNRYTKRHKQILELFKSGMKPVKITRKMGISAGCVYEVLWKNPEILMINHHSKRHEHIINLFKSGMKPRKIARTMALSPVNVYYILSKYPEIWRREVKWKRY